MTRKTRNPPAFITALLIIIGRGICGPIFHFSDTWHLVINTSTTIITFFFIDGAVVMGMVRD
ncbi:MAG: low affinity iron permease family protein [Terrimonas sp.]|nr:low affinity iron permease family protein [Terrimonas sp.]